MKVIRHYSSNVFAELVTPQFKILLICIFKENVEALYDFLGCDCKF